MIITAEISYYPLSDDFTVPIDKFLQKIKTPGVVVETGKMSTLISGEYSVVMKSISGAMEDLFNKYPSVFNLKISNSCMV